MKFNQLFRLFFIIGINGAINAKADLQGLVYKDGNLQFFGVPVSSVETANFLSQFLIDVQSGPAADKIINNENESKSFSRGGHSLGEDLRLYQQYLIDKKILIDNFSEQFGNKPNLVNEVNSLGEKTSEYAKIEQDRTIQMLLDSTPLLKKIAPADVTLAQWVLLQALEAGKVAANISKQDAQWLSDFVQTYSYKLTDELNEVIPFIANSRLNTYIPKRLKGSYEYTLEQWEIILKWNKNQQLSKEEKNVIPVLERDQGALKDYIKRLKIEDTTIFKRLRIVGAHHFVYRYDSTIDADRPIYIGSHILKAHSGNQMMNLEYYPNGYNGSYKSDYSNSQLYVQDLYEIWRNFSLYNAQYFLNNSQGLRLNDGITISADRINEFLQFIQNLNPGKKLFTVIGKNAIQLTDDLCKSIKFEKEQHVYNLKPEFENGQLIPIYSETYKEGSSYINFDIQANPQLFIWIDEEFKQDQFGLAPSLDEEQRKSIQFKINARLIDKDEEKVNQSKPFVDRFVQNQFVQSAKSTVDRLSSAGTEVVNVLFGGSDKPLAANKQNASETQSTNSDSIVVHQVNNHEAHSSGAILPLGAPIVQNSAHSPSPNRFAEVKEKTVQLLSNTAEVLGLGGVLNLSTNNGGKTRPLNEQFDDTDHPIAQQLQEVADVEGLVKSQQNMHQSADTTHEELDRDGSGDDSDK